MMLIIGIKKSVKSRGIHENLPHLFRFRQDRVSPPAIMVLKIVGGLSLSSYRFQASITEVI